MAARRDRHRFQGQIAGLGSTSGVRVVVGRWDSSPMGAFADVMLERADGHRVLYAPTSAVGDFVSQTYVFDEVRTVPVSVSVSPSDRGRRWEVGAGDLSLAFTVGTRPPLGWLLAGVPRPLAASPAWATLLDPVASRVLRGVRTRGQARSGRREWYGATDLHSLTSLAGSWRSVPLGTLADVAPPCRFGFSSTPSTPSVTSVVTTVALDAVGEGPGAESA